MAVEIRQVSVEALRGYGQIPMQIRVESILHVEEIDGGLGGLALREVKLTNTYVKDYDECEDQSPNGWPRRFDVSNWGVFLAFDGGQPVGGAVVAFRSPKVDMLEGRDDLAVLWDIRVHPSRRREGIGAALFQHAAGWARQRNCRQLKIETQNINVPACKFYARQGCFLGSILRHAYPDPVAGEVMLLWYLNLSDRSR